MDRRDFLNAGASCAAHVWLAAALVPAAARRAFGARPSGRLVAREPWGNLEQLSDGVWAMISTPLAGRDDAMRTFSNGGIVAGRSGVAIVEGFASNAGAQWMADAAVRLTGRRPTHVVLTHYHGDHSSGLAGYRAGGAGPIYVTTETTRATLREAVERRGRASPTADALAHAELVVPYREREGEDINLFVVNGDGSGRRRLVQRAVYGAMSPDGQWLAVAAYDRSPQAGTRYRLDLMRADGSKRRTLVPSAAN